MSKWVNKTLFADFADQKKNEADQSDNFIKRSDLVWQTPEKGTDVKPKIYKGRFLPNPDGSTKSDGFYVKYYYHMFKSGDKWFFTLCNKTYGMEEYCPFCSCSSKLYAMGTKDDKSVAKALRKKERFACNWYIVSDPRDAEKEPGERQEGNVRIYEFPSKVESKLKREITDTDEGWGYRVFDPGEDGVDFILNVKSTKPDAENNTYPDYADSTFSRNPKALDTEAGIEKIMASRHGINAYVKSMARDEDDIIAVLKHEQLWELVEAEYERFTGNTVTQHKQKDEVKQEEKQTATESKPFTVSDDDVSDEELLKELNGL